MADQYIPPLNWDTSNLNHANAEFLRAKAERVKAAEEARAQRKAELEAIKARGPLTPNMLIKLLEALPPQDRDKGISLEGCDCYGDMYSLEVEDEIIIFQRLEAF